MTDCLFCKIAQKTIKAEVVYENDDVLAFRDIRPQAPVHILVIPKQHIATINDIQPDQASLVGSLYLAAKAVAEQEKMAVRGYRTVMNCNADGGQEVYHIHLHVLGGRRLTWPPG